MPEAEKDDVGTTGDGLGDGKSAGEPQEDDETEDSPGTLAKGGGDSEMTQASGGSVD
jgi:hypothetical protein